MVGNERTSRSTGYVRSARVRAVVRLLQREGPKAMDNLCGTLDSDLSDPGTTGSNFGGSIVGRWYALAVPEDLRSVEAPLAEALAEAEART